MALSLEKRAPTEADARLIMNALLLPIYRWRPFPRPSLVPPVEPEKSRAGRAGLLHARNAHGAHRSFKQS